MIGLSPRTDRLPAGSLTEAEAKAVHEHAGTDLVEAARTLLDQFDDDGDGNLFNQKTFLGLRVGSELKTTTVKVTYTLGLLAGRPEHDFVKVTTRTSWSLARLLQKADVDGDDIASNREILAVLKGYDIDNDGRLSTAEFLRVRAEVGANRTGTSRTIDPVERKQGR